MGSESAAIIPLWLKTAYTMFVSLIAAVYVVKYRLGNFLWFSDVALLAAVPALWLESSLLASTVTVGVLLPEVLWNVSFFVQLTTGKRVSGLTDYMFETHRPLYLRALSLFHVFLPVLLVWMVCRLGYDPRAWAAMTALAWVVLPLSFFFTDPGENVNWVFGPGEKPQKRMPPLAYLGLLMIGFPVLIYLPSHWLLQRIFG